MSSRTELKVYFETGKKPTQQEYEDLIDSSVNKSEDKANLTEAADETIDDKYITPKTAKRAVETHLPMATTSDAGIVRRSSSAEVGSGANVNAYVTPSNTRGLIEDLAPGLAPVQSVNNMTGDVLLELGDDSGWIEPSLMNGITNSTGSQFQVARYRKKNGVVYIEGLITGGTTGQVNVFVLPLNYRPSKRLVFTVYGGIGGSQIAKRVDVQSSGAITFYDYDATLSSISGISFLVD